MAMEDRINPERHQRIKLGLKEAGTSLSKIARALAVTPQSVVISSQGHRISRRIDEALAAALGEEVEVLFPERYGPDVEA